jgi:secernin
MAAETLRLGVASCDTMVALPGRTVSGATIFAKNSDRPGLECQPLFQALRQSHAAGEPVRCQYLEIPQVEQTWGLIGSRPAWLWGFEHGINECGVAIGNEAIVTKDSLPAVGLLGMDLVRLGLERAASARAAMELIGALIERYGQGGSAAHDFDWRYSNGFMIADHAEAWILQSSGRQWAAHQVRDCASISNRTSTAAYERGSAEVQAHALAEGWWDGRARFDFAAAYAPEQHPMAFFARGRLERSRELIGRAGRRSVRELFAVLRDHQQAVEKGFSQPAPSLLSLPEGEKIKEGSRLSRRGVENVHFSNSPGLTFSTPGWEMGELPVITAPAASERNYSLCMHTESAGTTASMVAEISAPDAGVTPVIWAAMAAPCTGVFMPLYAAGTIPAALTSGGMEPSRDSPWWRMKAIQDRVAQAPERLAPIVWRSFRPLEDEMLERAATIAVRGRDLAAQARAAMLTEFMADNVSRVLEAVVKVEGGLRAAQAG